MSAEKPPVRFQRANFIVADIERALLFYRDVLKFKVAFQKESEKDSYSYPVFEIDRDCKMQWAVLSAEGQPRVMALTEGHWRLCRIRVAVQSCSILRMSTVL